MDLQKVVLSICLLNLKVYTFLNFAKLEVTCMLIHDEMLSGPATAACREQLTLKVRSHDHIFVQISLKISLYPYEHTDVNKTSFGRIYFHLCQFMCRLAPSFSFGITRVKITWVELHHIVIPCVVQGKRETCQTV